MKLSAEVLSTVSLDTFCFYILYTFNIKEAELNPPSSYLKRSPVLSPNVR
jgi:hypothetical protein